MEYLQTKFMNTSKRTGRVSKSIFKSEVQTPTGATSGNIKGGWGECESQGYQVCW